ncbi:MAG TPA: CBS domain-containing protein [Verrucomicrobiae bacterium]|nr:CBS domain-containing protein [Verrucomicrobiae bacterium]
MQLSQVLKRRVDAVTPDTRLTDVARKMIAQRTNALPVCRDGRLVGVLSVRDLIWRTTSEGRDPTLATVSEVMNARVVRCFEDADPHEAIRLMRKNRVTQIWVISRDEQLLGAVSLGDLSSQLDAMEGGHNGRDPESANET